MFFVVNRNYYTGSREKVPILKIRSTTPISGWRGRNIILRRFGDRIDLLLFPSVLLFAAAYGRLSFLQVFLWFVALAGDPAMMANYCYAIPP